MKDNKKDDEEWLKKVINGAFNEAKSKGLGRLNCFKAVMRSVLVDTLKALGINRNTLHFKIKKLGIRVTR